MKILLVEDDEIIVSALTEALTTYHYHVETAKDGISGLELAIAFHYDLLVLDIILPGLDGISLCRQLRSHGLKIPILLLSAKDRSSDRVKGLEAGADDYLVKPYDLSELIARIQALLRRGKPNLPVVLTWEKLQLDPDTCQVSYGGKLLHLTPKEYSILELFLRNPQRIFSRSAILDRIWSNGEFPQEEAVSTQIKGLRQKLKAAGMSTNLIETMYGLGYRLKAVPEDLPSPKVSQAELGSPGEQRTASTITEAEKHIAQAKVQAVVARLWDKLKASLESKFLLFEQAIAQIDRGTIDIEIQQQAKLEAHRLIGSLGTFGLPQGSEVAREMEKLFQAESLGQEQVKQFEELLEQLKQVVEIGPVKKSAVSPPKVVSGRLLIIDDDLMLAAQIKREAIACGLQVEVAADLTTARKQISCNPPNVILLDLTFPETTENGLTLLGELTQQTPTIPVLVLTGRKELSDRVEVACLGGDAFLQKSMSPEQILKAVTQVLNRTQKAEAKVLIVDDDRHILAALAMLLEPWGFEVTTLANPQKFWLVLEASKPDLLILDIEMPNFSGIELCRVVRNDPHWSKLPVLFLSARKDAETLYQVFAIGADDYIYKPIVEQEFIARILKRLERKS